MDTLTRSHRTSGLLQSFTRLRRKLPGGEEVASGELSVPPAGSSRHCICRRLGRRGLGPLQPLRVPVAACRSCLPPFCKSCRGRQSTALGWQKGQPQESSDPLYISLSLFKNSCALLHIILGQTHWLPGLF